eukprot:TRINITY_DN20783_c0_g1_i1.p1 TRINITY_DN20783_c0_g1~~TRINITY_DN20783_c0_g1_i1.p1  ORF type:complete len:451 (+),score=87.88 TRINITY_DN20783_c0_g1_i1:3-1355(+)
MMSEELDPDISSASQGRWDAAEGAAGGEGHRRDLSSSPGSGNEGHTEGSPGGPGNHHHHHNHNNPQHHGVATPGGMTLDSRPSEAATATEPMGPPEPGNGPPDAERPNPLPRGLVAGAYRNDLQQDMQGPPRGAYGGDPESQCNIAVPVEDSDDGAEIEGPAKLNPLQLYRGNNILVCGGRCGCVLGPNTGFCLLAEALIVVPMLAYVVFVLPWLSSGWVIAGIILCLIPVVFLSKTATTDPGILRRYQTPPVESPQPGLHVRFRGDTVRAWFCSRCNTYRSPRAKHCYVCDNCVEVFDHHCPWVGTCVGKRNYCFFLWFLTTTHVAIFYIAASILYFWLTVSRDNKETVSEASKRSELIPAFILLGYITLATFFVGGLTFYHYYLSLTAQTTREHLKNYGVDRLPYSQGRWSNIVNAFLGTGDSVDGFEDSIVMALNEKYKGKVNHNRA